MSHSLEIKNLSIALEALSRIQSLGTSYYDVEKLLQAAIEKQVEENNPIQTWRAPAPPPNHKPIDDDIPF